MDSTNRSTGQVSSRDEFGLLPPTGGQQKLNAVLNKLVGRYSELNGISRRQFIKTASGIAAAFLALNGVYGRCFEVSETEAADLSAANERAAEFANQFIFDDQVHYVHDRYKRTGVLQIRERAKAEGLNPEMANEQTGLDKLHFPNFFRELYQLSDTRIAMLSNAPADEREDWFLTNSQVAGARDLVDQWLGVPGRLLVHSVFAPGQTAWLDQIDIAIDKYKPDAWKGYTVGDPLENSRYPYRLDDEKLVYPAYEKFVKSGIKNVCIHKGLLPDNFRETYTNWKYGMVDDLPKAAKDWPGLNFIIYHAAFAPGGTVDLSCVSEFEKSGRIDWVSDLAEMPGKYGLKNIYADIGGIFANTCISNPRIAAGILGTLIKGMGDDRVLWGTDSVWWGSPQWQIEAMRRIEIPEDLQKKFGYTPLGGATSGVKEKIFSGNGVKLYQIDVERFRPLRAIEKSGTNV